MKFSSMRNGDGKFQTGPEGDYGFLFSGNYRNKLRLSVDGQQIIDLKNMWLPLSAGAKIHLAANTTYKVLAETGGDTKLAVRLPSDTMGFRSQVGEAVDYYFLYGPDPSRVVAEYREFTGAAPLLPRWAYGFWQCRERYSSQQQILDTAAEFRKRKIPVDVLVQDWQYWGKYGWNAMRFDESAYPESARDDVCAAQAELPYGHLCLGEVRRGDGGGSKNSSRTTWCSRAPPAPESPAKRRNARTGRTCSIRKRRRCSGPKSIGTCSAPGSMDGGSMLLSRRAIRSRMTRPSWVRNERAQRISAIRDFCRVSRAEGYNRRQERRHSYSIGLHRRAAQWRQSPGQAISRQIGRRCAGRSRLVSVLPCLAFPIGQRTSAGSSVPTDQYTSPEYHELLIRWFQFGAFCPIFRIHGFRSETEMWKYGPEVEKVLRAIR